MKKRHVATILIVLGHAFMVCSLVVYAYNAGFLSPLFSNHIPHPVIMIQNASWINSTGQIKVYVQNIGAIPFTLSEVYVNGTLDSSAEFTSSELPRQATSEITISKTYETQPKETMIKIVISGNTFVERRFNLIIIPES